MLPQNLFAYVKKMEDYKRDLCVCGIHVYHAKLAHHSTSLCQSDLWGCIDCMRLVFSSPLPGCPSPPPPALLDLSEQLLELVLRTKVSLLGLVSHLYTVGTAIEPF